MAFSCCFVLPHSSDRAGRETVTLTDSRINLHKEEVTLKERQNYRWSDRSALRGPGVFHPTNHFTDGDNWDPEGWVGWLESVPGNKAWSLPSPSPRRCSDWKRHIRQIPLSFNFFKSRHLGNRPMPRTYCIPGKILSACQTRTSVQQELAGIWTIFLKLSLQILSNLLKSSSPRWKGEGKSGPGR